LNIPKYPNIIIYQREREREYPLESPRLEVWDDFPDSGLPTFSFFATETWMNGGSDLHSRHVHLNTFMASSEKSHHFNPN